MFERRKNMNEKQRTESGQVNPSDKKSEKDYSKYFEAVYVPPSLKDAKNAAKKPLNTIAILKYLSSTKALERGGSFISAHTDAR